MGNTALGAFAGSGWSEKLTNAANQMFVRDFEAEFGRRPGLYAAHAFDAAQLVSAALRQAGGAANKGRLRDALRVVEFASVRGQFKFNRNHFPVQNFYLTQVTEDQGRLVGAPRGVILASHADAYAADCRMKWQ
jgi:branched-chain amino acid transport system substrate-binding protein